MVNQGISFENRFYHGVYVMKGTTSNCFNQKLSQIIRNYDYFNLIQILGITIRKQKTGRIRDQNSFLSARKNVKLPSVIGEDTLKVSECSNLYQGLKYKSVVIYCNLGQRKEGVL